MSMLPCGMLLFCTSFEFTVSALKMALSVHTTQPLTYKAASKSACAACVGQTNLVAHTSAASLQLASLKLNLLHPVSGEQDS